jgi:hypothetical protein
MMAPPSQELEPPANPGRFSLGNWTDAEIEAAIRSGKRPGGRELAPIMPWHAFAALVQAMVAFLRSIKPVNNTLRHC